MIHIGFGFILVTLFLIVLFAEIYRRVDCLCAIDAYYHSVLIQTLVGAEYEPKQNICKIFTMIQALVSYTITAGALIWLR